jgi:hypothetical protein
MPQKTVWLRGRCRFVVLKIAALLRTLGIDGLDTDVLASVIKERSSHRWTSKIKARPSIFARRASDSASPALARVVPKSIRAPQCFDFESYFFVWWESWVIENPLLNVVQTRYALSPARGGAKAEKTILLHRLTVLDIERSARIGPECAPQGREGGRGLYI